MKQFKLIDTLMGWVAFAIAATVYCCTVEPTASFWDCPEFILSAFKLEVGHPPGAPFFMLMGNVIAQFTDDVTKVALMMNIMSALCSAACILFLFWSISHLTRKLVGEHGQVKTWGQCLTIELAAMTGALAYTFSDTFWFSAVEGEVYASSSLFTAAVFWLMLKWEENADKPGADRWLILIAYLTGLSIGVHLLNLLCLPALVLIWYFKRHTNPNVKGSLLALLGSFVLVAVVLYGIVPGIVRVGGWFELLFVNTLGFGFNTGLVVYIFLLISTVLWAIYESTKQKSRLRMSLSFVAAIGMLGIPFYGHDTMSIFLGIVLMGALFLVLHSIKNKEGEHFVSARLMNTTLLCLLMIMIGYSSYAVIVIRSEANTPMDQNSPEDVFTLGSYLARDQYGDSPLIYGQPFSAPVKMEVKGDYYVPVSNEGAPQYQRVEKKTPDEPDRYELIGHKNKYVYTYNMLFPRMHSERHRDNYEEWMGGLQGKVVTIDHLGERKTIKVPTMMENLRFFFSYQVNFMYWRYFMWNFAGRQNDIQSSGEVEHGNWLTGIPFIDNWRLGDQDLLPSELRQNKGHNVFYCLPLILGLLGLIWQVNKTIRTREGREEEEGVKQFWVVFFLFFMTGLAIVLYLNQTPEQPRERDYAYAGSFYAYAIWIGLGVAAISDFLRRLFKGKELPAAVLSGLCLLVPVQMASQTWDDHDRSGRYTCRDFGQNYLMTLPEGCAPIIYTNGDNDTFPLWYCQEVEGIRTDARVCNLSYLQTDWYIDQMRRPAYDSPSVPIRWKRLDYVTGTREAIPVRPGMLEQAIEYYKNDPLTMRAALGENPYELSTIIDKWILSDNESLQMFPTDSVVITIDKEAVRRSGMMIAGDSIPDVMHINLKGKRAVYKSEMMIYEMLCRTNWERPIYVAATVGASNYGSLGVNFVREGLADRITPFNTEKSGRRVDTERMYDNVMNRYRWGNLTEPGIYLDETVTRMCYTHRRLLASLALELVREGKGDKALAIAQLSEEKIPASVLPHNYLWGSMDIAQVWMALSHNDKAEAIAAHLATTACEYLQWYASLKPSMQAASKRNIIYNVYQLGSAIEMLEMTESPILEEMDKKLETYQMMFAHYLYN